MQTPREPESDDDETRPTIPAPGSVPRGARRLLLIDDDLGIETAVRRTLRRICAVDACAGAREALVLLERGTCYDVFLVDVRMPKIGGVELFLEIEQRFPELVSRFVFMTGGTREPELVSLLERTGRPCLDKPFEPVELESAILACAAR